jgi:hypothetical protein
MPVSRLALSYEYVDTMPVVAGSVAVVILLASSYGGHADDLVTKVNSQRRSQGAPASLAWWTAALATNLRLWREPCCLIPTARERRISGSIMLQREPGRTAVEHRAWERLAQRR